KLLAEVADTIIPATDTPGAKDLYTHLFTMKMVDDCLEKGKQDEFVTGLHQLNNVTRKQYNNDFINCTPTQRQAILIDLENKKTDSKELQSFYSTMKGLTIRAYMTSI